jgi:hypothetical protein
LVTPQFEPQTPGSSGFHRVRGSWLHGIQAYLEGYSQELGNQAVYIILDEVGIGKIKYLSADGLVLKHKTHPQALRLAREISSAHPELETVERVGVAYTDALSATKRGLSALTVCTEADPKSGAVSHWHQMSDTLDTLEPVTLQHAHQFVWRFAGHRPAGWRVRIEVGPTGLPKPAGRRWSFRRSNCAHPRKPASRQAQKEPGYRLPSTLR